MKQKVNRSALKNATSAIGSRCVRRFAELGLGVPMHQQIWFDSIYTRLAFLGMVALLCIPRAIAATSPPSFDDPAPVHVVTLKPPQASNSLKVLRTAKGEPLRGPSLWQWKSSPEHDRRDDRNSLLDDHALFREFRKTGMTAIRLTSFEVWFQSDRQPYADWSWSDLSNEKERRALLKMLDRAVDTASKADLYIIINAHNKFNAYSHDYTIAFWEVVAPYFANRPHVLYELSNEIRTGPSDYTDDDLKQHVALSRLVRKLAPNTFQLVLTPSGTWAPSQPDGTGLDLAAMEKLAERFSKEWTAQGDSCDWKRTAIGYHLYFNGKTSEILTRLHHRFPGLPTEVNFPYGMAGLEGIKPDDTARSESMDGMTFANEVCERLGLGWLQWHTETREKWQKNIPLILQDAKKQGYAWPVSP